MALVLRLPYFSLPKPPPFPFLLRITDDAIRTSPAHRTPADPYLTRSLQVVAPSSASPGTNLHLIHILFLTSQALQALPLTLGHQKARQHTQKHEKRKYLHNAVDPGRRIVMRSATLDHGREEDLCKHGTELPHAG